MKCQRNFQSTFAKIIKAFGNHFNSNFNAAICSNTFLLNSILSHSAIFIDFLLKNNVLKASS